MAETGSGLEVAIPARKNWVLVFFSGCWMLAWAVGEFAVLWALLRGETDGGARLFLLAWLGGWTAAGGFVGYSWMWTVFGVERVTLRPTMLVIKRDVFGMGRERRYDLAHVKNLRLATASFNPFDFSAALQYWGVAGGLIAFDYGAKTFRFGAGVDEAEAGQIVSRLKGRHAFG